MRLYHLLPAEYAVQDIVFKRLKVARLSEVNDPFELLAVNVGGQKAVRRALKEWKTFENDSVGILSFTQGWSHPALWSHYAAKHRGICLGFDVADSILREINYVDERIRAEFKDDEVPDDFDKALVDSLRRTKYSHWNYENEKRVFVRLDECVVEGSLYFRPFSSTLQLRQVILGHLCDYRLRDLRNLVSAFYASVEVTRARLAFKSFRVVTDQRTVQRNRGLRERVKRR
jgi:hypothetical protein